MFRTEYKCHLCKRWVADTVNSDGQLISSKLLHTGESHICISAI